MEHFIVRPRNFRSNVFAGIQVDRDKNIQFNWSSDTSNDIMSLCSDTSGEFGENGVRFVYGYQFNRHIRSRDAKIVRDYVKGISDSSNLYSKDIETLVERAIDRLDDRYSLDTFQTLVRVQPTKSPSLVDLIRQHLVDYMDDFGISFDLIKETYENVQFDADKAANALRAVGMSEKDIQYEIDFTIDKFENLKKSGELFQMKRFLPKQIRRGFYGFLKFRSEEEKEAYESLQGVDVLIYDDFMTSGTTVNEVIRYLRAIHDKNTLTVFVLIKQ